MVVKGVYVFFSLGPPSVMVLYEEDYAGIKRRPLCFAFSFALLCLYPSASESRPGPRANVVLSASQSKKE